TSSSVIAAPPIEDAPGRLERMASPAAGVYPKLAAPVPRRGLEQAGQPPGAVSVAWQAEHQPAAVPVPGEAQQRVGAVRAQQEAVLLAAASTACKNRSQHGEELGAGQLRPPHSSAILCAPQPEEHNNVRPTSSCGTDGR